MEKLATKFPSDNEIQDKYVPLLLQNAKGYFQDQIFEQAKPMLGIFTHYPDYRATANEYLYSIDVAQKNYPAALDKLNRLIANNPRNDDYLFKKASLLEEMGRFDEAIKISNFCQKS